MKTCVRWRLLLNNLKGRLSQLTHYQVKLGKAARTRLLSYCYNVLTLFLDDFATNLDTEIPVLLKSIFNLIISVAPTALFPHTKLELIDKSML